jgi:hypothetical protein
MVHMAKLSEYMKSKPEVWFANSEQVADYIKKNSPPAASAAR